MKNGDFDAGVGQIHKLNEAATGFANQVQVLTTQSKPYECTTTSVDNSLPLMYYLVMVVFCNFFWRSTSNSNLLRESCASIPNQIQIND